MLKKAYPWKLVLSFALHLQTSWNFGYCQLATRSHQQSRQLPFGPTNEEGFHLALSLPVLLCCSSSLYWPFKGLARSSWEVVLWIWLLAVAADESYTDCLCLLFIYEPNDIVHVRKSWIVRVLTATGGLGPWPIGVKSPRQWPVVDSASYWSAGSSWRTHLQEAIDVA